ncbi:hypothetical protein D3D03_02660 [Exiguobacterium sp. RIT452]|uniref:hypothetical protein n=1 Tax=Exiguobacterium sp. RIT452 TaxID=2315552 RepID=UPI000E72A9D6|nr:hypothetical protein [Exiguobacterium sp. RIT452]RJP02256.1 hypothetical protein D3D03_02660 [Exiguobacterium sp. RIT452]
MKQYLMLTNEELKRSWKMIVSVILAMASIEILIIVGRVIYHERQVKEYMSYAKLSESDAIETIGKLSFEQASSYFSYVIMIGIVLVILYAIQIWYRDWLGESKYIYRLLLLPGSRAKIFFAKWTSLALVIISFIGLQWVVIQLSYVIFNWLIKDDYRASSFNMSMALKQLYTMNVVDLLLIVLVSLFVVSFLFMLILLERSYRKAKGLIFIILEVSFLLLITVGNMYVIEKLDIFLSQEISAIMVAIFVLYFVYTIWKSLRLLKWKISV